MFTAVKVFFKQKITHIIFIKGRCSLYRQISLHIICLLYTSKGFIFDIVRVDGSSMFPTLVDNDRLIVTKLGYTPKQGDIIILDSEYKNREEYFDRLAESKDKEELSSFEKFFAQSSMPSNLKKKYYVKRIIAMPGQTIDLVDGKVYVDGEMLDEPYYDGLTTSIDTTVEYPITVDDDCVFAVSYTHLYQAG